MQCPAATAARQPFAKQKCRGRRPSRATLEGEGIRGATGVACRPAVPGSRAAMMPSGSAFARFTTMLWTVDLAYDRTTWRGLTSS
jgi:hypothetical protein